MKRHVVLLLAVSLVSLANLSRVANAAKVDCYPINGASKEKCQALGCIWSPVDEAAQQSAGAYDRHEPPFGGRNQEKPRVSEPWCYFPENYQGYKVTNNTLNGSGGRTIGLTRTRPSALGDDVQNLVVEINLIGSNAVHMKIYDPDTKRFEPEIPKLNLDSSALNTPDAATLNDVKIELKELPKTGGYSQLDGPGATGHQLIISRASTGALWFSTHLGKMIFSDKFIQINSDLDSRLVHGLGEHYSNFLKVADSYQPYSFYHFDRLALPGGLKSYGGFPFFVNREAKNKSQAHGVYLRNSNAMDIVLQPEPSITFRPIGGVLDFYLLLGPTANDVVSQYQHLVGLPAMPPRWALGFHLCRFEYASLDKVKAVSRRTREAGIPYDVQWTDADAMDRRNDFTYDHDKYKGLPEFVDELHSMNMHYVPLIDPGISLEPGYYPYDLGRQLDVFTKNATNQTLIAKVWNFSGKTVFVDFSNPVSHDYWSTMFDTFQKVIKFDGAWIDMNDVSSFVSGSIDGCPSDDPYEHPPYLPGGSSLQEHSICLSAKHAAGIEYNVHNLYSFYEAIATYKALLVARPQQRPLIISRSSSPGQGHYGGHWSGDLYSNWDYLRWSVVQLIEHSMYGFSLVGSDICGFSGNTTPELCARWSTLGAFYTFSRNHNDDTSIDQDPVALGPDVVAANKNALTKRYSLLPYLYTLMYRANRFGEPVVKSLQMDFYPQDEATLKVEYQFMWGKALMVSPIVDQNTYTKSSYLPKGRWYETDVLPDSESRVPRLVDSNGEWYDSKNVSLANLVLFYRGGHILPTYRDVRQTIPETVKQPFGLEIALCPMAKAHGQIYIDDGDTLDENNFDLIKMDVQNSRLTLKSVKFSTQKFHFGSVKVFGVSQNVKQVTVVSTDTKDVNFTQQDHMLSFRLDTWLNTDVPISATWA